MGAAAMPDGELELLTVNPELLDFCWSEISGPIAKALEHTDEMGLDNIRVMIASGECIAYAAKRDGVLKGVAVVRIVRLPRYKSANIIAMGGRGAVVDLEILEALKAQLRLMGCSKMQFIARESAARLYRRVGIHGKATFFREDL